MLGTHLENRCPCLPLHELTNSFLRRFDLLSLANYLKRVSLRVRVVLIHINGSEKARLKAHAKK